MLLPVGKVQRIFIGLLIFIWCIFSIQSQATFSSGTTNDITRIVQSGSNFTMNCTVTRSNPRSIPKMAIEWKYPHKNEQFWTTFGQQLFGKRELVWLRNFRELEKITPVQNRSVVSQKELPDGSFLSTLAITNASYFDTGFYTCIIRDGPNGRIIQTSKQHVFVEDLNSLFVPPTSSDKERPELIGIISRPNLTIGCQPTHPSVRMQLFYIRNPVLKDRKLIASSNNSFVNDSWSYNPMQGFIFIKPITSDIIGLYQCMALERPGNQPFSRRTSFEVVFEVKISGVEMIHSTTEQQVPGDTPFEITCHGRNRLPQTSTEMRLSWLWIPDEPINGVKKVLLNETVLPPGLSKMNNSISINKQELEHPVYTSSIKWQSIPFEASGTYQCSDLNNDLYPPAITRLNVSFQLPQPFPGYLVMQNRYIYVSKELERRFNLEEIIYNAGHPFQLECKSRTGLGFLMWIKINEVNAEFYTELLPKSLKKRWSDSRFSSDGNFTIAETTMNGYFLDTGYHFCLGLDVDGSYNLHEAKFIFVLDSKHLVLPPALEPVGSGPKREFRVVVSYGEKNVPIGCGPTHPNVQVFLGHKNRNEEYKVIASSLSPDDEKSVWKFTTHGGFMMKTVDMWEMEGEFICKAKWPNETTTTSVTNHFQILIKGIEITSSNVNTIFEGDEVILTCKSKNINNVTLSWTWLSQSEIDFYMDHILQLHGGRPNKAVTSDMPIGSEAIGEIYPTLQGNFTVLQLRLKEIEVNASGLYQCYDKSDMEAPVQSISINVSLLEIPIINIPQQQILYALRSEQVVCKCTLGNDVVSKVKIEWFVVKSESLYLIESPSSGYTINTTKDRRTSELIVHQIVTNSKFKCVFSNWKGNATKEFIVNVPKIWSDGEIAAVTIAFIVIIAIAIILVRWKFVKSIRKQKRKYQTLVNTRLKLLEGNLERINPDKPIQDQIESLPYDPKYEFPVDRLILGKQLGVGQFGRVIQAEAMGLGPSGNKTVAVKMVKNETETKPLSSLASELKILIHLGCHLNVVNLLGACTKKLNKGELLVIVEFCRYGSLKDFLLSNRSNFINELVIDSDLILDCQNKGIDKAHLSVEQSASLLNSTQKEKEQQDEAGYLIPHKKTDQTTRKPSVCVHDLMNWSFQIARGMNYLTNKKVLHGDLAARNVLLADNDIVKIADFGLSRQLYQNCDYEKQGEEALPVKWMAIESLVDRVFSSKSDVWAFGVTMWEIFTLGQQPYPKVLGYPCLIEFLQSGHRMEKPEYAPKVIGKIMSDCWEQNPDTRVTFAQLEQILERLVDETTLQRITSNEQEYLYTELGLKSTIVSHDYSNISSQATGEYETMQGGYENVMKDSRESSKEGMGQELELVSATSYTNPSFKEQF